MVSQKDVAKKAGVSSATVSAVVNKNKFVSKKLKRRVLKAIKELNYRSDEIARILATRKRINFIGLLISDINNMFFSEFSKYIEDEVKKRNYNLILFNTNYRMEEEKKYLDILIRNRVSGVIIATPEINDENINLLINGKFPFVMFGSKVNNKKASVVSIDNFKAASLATNYLIKKGHKKIFYITRIFKNTEGGISRLNGYLAELKKNNIEINKNYIYKINDQINSDFEIGYKAAEKLLKLKNKPTAIFAYNDFVAIGIMEFLLERGYKVPNDYSLISIDDIKIASLKMIDLTTVHQPIFEQAKRSVEVLFTIIEKKSKKIIKETSFDLKIIERSSVLDISKNLECTPKRPV